MTCCGWKTTNYLKLNNDKTLSVKLKIGPVSLNDEFNPTEDDVKKWLVEKEIINGLVDGKNSIQVVIFWLVIEENL